MALLTRYSCLQLFQLLGRLGAAIGSSLTLAGRGTAWQPPTVRCVTVGTNTDQTIDATLRKEFQATLNDLTSGFQRIYPNTTFQREGIEIPFPQQVQNELSWPPEQHQPRPGTAPINPGPTA